MESSGKIGVDGWVGMGTLYFVRGRMVIGETVGLSVILVEPTDTVHLVVDAAGDVFNVLHVGSAGYVPITELGMISNEQQT